MEPERPPLEEVRARLRERGYLEGRLSLWIASGGAGGASVARRAVSAGLRVGLVGGPVLALPVAAALALSARPQAPALREIAGLWIFLSVLLGGALAALEAATDLVMVWLARRGMVLLGRAERLAGRVGLIFAAAATLYLLFHVRGGRASAAASGGGADLPGWLLWGALMLAALGAGHVVGRLVKLGSLGAILAGPADPAGAATPPGLPRRPPRRRWPALAGWGAALAAGLLLVFVPVPPAAPQAGESPRIEPAAVPGRIVFVGVDGLDGALLDRLTDFGELATLRSLLEDSARYGLVSGEPPVPPRRWTTAITGRPSEEHGVIGYQAEKIPGLSSPLQTPVSRTLWPPSPHLLIPPRVSTAAPVDSRMRRSPGVWEIMAGHGVEAAALNWWATWPAPRRPGAFVVSDRAFARLQAGRTGDRDVSPDAFEAGLRERFAGDLAAARARLAAAGLGGQGPGAAGALADAWHARVAARLLKTSGVRCLALYLPGLDIARRSQPVSVPGVLAVLDLALEDLLQEMDEQDLLLLAGDPGRSGGRPGAAPGGAPEGVLLVHGGRVAGHPLPGAFIRMHDLAPTLLALSGLPAALDLPGEPVLDFLTPLDPARRLPPPIATYGSVPIEPPGEREDDPFARDVLDRLRGLGYIQ